MWRRLSDEKTVKTYTDRIRTVSAFFRIKFVVSFDVRLDKKSFQLLNMDVGGHHIFKDGYLVNSSINKQPNGHF